MRDFLTALLKKTGNWGFPILIAFACFIYGSSQKGWDNTFINGDGKGYYAYLPAFFIYHDLSFGFIEKYEQEHYKPGQLADFRQPVKGGIVNRYFIGTAVAQLPFFLITHSICRIFGRDADGYSRPYQYTVLFAASFYLFLGLWALFSFLGNFFSKQMNVFILVCITFATPLLFYTIYNPDFSHIYSFAFISLFILYAFHFFKQPSVKLIYFLFFLLGIIALIRPVNLIIIFILPFLALSWSNLKDKISFLIHNYKALFAGVFLFLLVIFLQLFTYYHQTGNLIVYSYGEAGFDFLHPNFFNFLFSYRKGLFIYTPLLFISLGGFIYLLKESFYKFITLFLFLIALIYALSSWTVWTYGMTYGQRPIIEYYFLFAILLGYLLKLSKSKIITNVTIGLIALTIPHNLMQMSQHRHYIFHWDEMDKDKYWKVFFRTDPLYYGYLWNPVFPISDDTSGYVTLKLAHNAEVLIKPLQSITPISFHSDSTSDSLNIILSMQILPENEALKKNFIHVMVRRKENYTVDGFDFEINMRNLEPQKWNVINKLVKLPIRSTEEEFVITIANYGKYNFRLDSIRILKKI